MATFIGECSVCGEARKIPPNTFGVCSPCMRSFDAVLKSRRSMPDILAWATKRARKFANVKIKQLQKQVAELEESCRMACITPADNCQCAGCLYADEMGGC